MANIRVSIEYDGFKSEEYILLKDMIQELLRRVKVKQVPCPVDEVTHQVISELDGVVSGNVVKKLIRLIVDQINQESS
jgi:hypothetical protein